MKIMLTSFGIGQEYLPEIPHIPDAFRRLPPLSMRSGGTPFEPEYSLLVLCDKLILDELSFERLGENSPPIFAKMAKTIKLLYDEGFVELADYSSILRENVGLLQKMTDSDIAHGSWDQALYASGSIWQEYLARAVPDLTRIVNPRRLLDLELLLSLAYHRAPHGYPAEDFRLDFRSYSPYQNDKMAQEVIKAYLVYVNSNLILSNETESALHDWEDFLPFYRMKFLGIGKPNPPGVAQIDASRQLFDIALPELAIDSPEHLLRVLKHRHVEELRKLIAAASEGDVEFDSNFAKNVFREVFGTERKAAKGRRIVGYVTMPIGFIPLIGNFAQALVQEAAGTLLERRLRKPYRWLYMLSDLAQQPTTPLLPKHSQAEPTD